MAKLLVISESLIFRSFLRRTVPTDLQMDIITFLKNVACVFTFI